MARNPRSKIEPVLGTSNDEDDANTAIAALRMSLEEERVVRTSSYAALAADILRVDTRCRTHINATNAQSDDFGRRLAALEAINLITDDADRPVHFATWRKLVAEVRDGSYAGAVAVGTAVSNVFGAVKAAQFLGRLKAAARAARANPQTQTA